MDRLVDEAQRLLGLGYKVLPLAPGEKRPHPRLAPRGLKDAKGGMEALSWWKEVPQAGLGLLPPPEVLVLDVDRPSTLEELLRRYPLGEAPRVRTPRGGAHLYLRLPPGVDLPARGGALPGVDLRGMGKAYLVAPPTALPLGAYRYEVPLGPPEALPLLPLDLLEELRSRLPTPPPLPPAPLGREREGRLLALARSLAERVAAARPGERHNQLLRYSLAAGGLIPYGLAPETAEALLLEAGLRTGLPYGEVLRTVRWGLEKGRARPIRLD